MLKMNCKLDRRQIISPIYVSTGGFGSKYVETTVSELVNSGIFNIELSGGISQSETLKFLKSYKKKGCNFVLHNYFPAPKINPFVLNLGSANKTIRNRSREMISNALRWSSELESNFYAIHAPFRIDPSINNLGKGFIAGKLADRDKTLRIFCNEYCDLRELGKQYGVELSVENNVISSTDHKVFGSNQPFIFTGTDHALFSYYLGDEISFLMDYGHLKVSSTSLQFNPIEVLDQLATKIRWCHLSDNNGLVDSNETFDEHVWFLQNVQTLSVPKTLEIYGHGAEKLREIRENLMGVL